MNLQFLLDNFRTLAESPNGTSQLRDIVLTLAVEGELVRQQSSDRPSEALLQEIRRLRPGNSRRRSRGSSSVVDSNEDRSLPHGWELVRFPDIAEWAIGSGFPKRYQGYVDKKFMFCKVGDMNREGNERFINTTANTIDEAIKLEAKVKTHPAGTVIFPKIGGAIATNKRRILKAETAIDNNCLGLTPYPGVTSDWLFVLLSSIDLSRYQSGTSVPALSQSVLDTITFGLPPTAEQQRIVAKVDELMALIDHYEAAKNAREESRKAFRDSALQALQDAADADEVQKAWKLVSDNIDEMFVEPEDVDELRSGIRSLAINGLLTSHSDDDEPVDELLHRVEQTRVQQVDGSTARNPKSLPNISPPEVPSNLPKGWTVARLGEFVNVVRGITFPKGAKFDRPAPGRVACLRTANVQSSIDWNDLIYVPSEYVKNDEQFVRESDIVMSTANSRELVGKVARVSDAPTMAAFGGFVTVLRPIIVEPEFLMVVLRETTVRNTLIGSATQTTNIANISIGRLRPLIVRLPSLEEQQRIVTKVDALMTLCDHLESTVLSSSLRSAQLANSAIQAGRASAL